MDDVPVHDLPLTGEASTEYAGGGEAGV
jgi:hypothetical protein